MHYRPCRISGPLKSSLQEEIFLKKKKNNISPVRRSAPGNHRTAIEFSIPGTGRTRAARPRGRSPGAAGFAVLGTFGSPMRRIRADPGPPHHPLQGRDGGSGRPFRGKVATRAAGQVAPSRARAQIAYLQGIVAARLTFDEVLHILVPLTQWWQAARPGEELN